MSLGKSNDKIPADELALAAHIARIEAKNAKFDSLSPAQKRVAIARDVLLWVGIGRLTPKPGTYLWTQEPPKEPGLKNGCWVDTRVVNGFNCTACALGSVFAACADRIGGFAGRDLMSFDSEEMRVQLGGYFEKEQLELMECAFESFESVNETKDRAAHAYCLDTTREAPGVGTKRLVRIMQNIIRNKGTFNPRDLTGLPANHPVRAIVAEEATEAARDSQPSNA